MKELENKIKKVALSYFNDRFKVDLWYKISNPYLNGLSPSEIVRQGKGEWLLQECKNKRV